MPPKRRGTISQGTPPSERQRFSRLRAPNTKGIAALQAHDPFAAERTADHERSIVSMLDGVTSGALPT